MPLQVPGGEAGDNWGSLMYQILYKGANTLVKDPYIFSVLIRMLSEKDFNVITVEKMKDE